LKWAAGPRHNIARLDFDLHLAGRQLFRGADFRALNDEKIVFVTRVTGFLWDRGRDRLWRQGIDLIGDDRRRQVSEGIEDGAMLGQSEGGEFLDVTDDGFDDVAPVEQGLVEERHR